MTGRSGNEAPILGRARIDSPRRVGWTASDVPPETLVKPCPKDRSAVRFARGPREAVEA